VVYVLDLFHVLIYSLHSNKLHLTSPTSLPISVIPSSLLLVSAPGIVSARLRGMLSTETFVAGQCSASTTCESIGYTGFCCSQYGVSATLSFVM
jgi:hypothetical protein